jgi:hypothetical protein
LIPYGLILLRIRFDVPRPRLRHPLLPVAPENGLFQPFALPSGVVPFVPIKCIQSRPSAIVLVLSDSSKMHTSFQQLGIGFVASNIGFLAPPRIHFVQTHELVNARVCFLSAEV